MSKKVEEEKDDAGSITPRTVKKSTSHIVERVQVTNGLKKISEIMSALHAKHQDFDHVSRKLTWDLDSVVDQTTLEKYKAEFKKFKKDFDDKINRLSIYEGLVRAYDAFCETNEGLNLYQRVCYANSHSSVSRFGINTNILTFEQSQEFAKIYDHTQVQEAGSVGSKSSGARSSKKSKKVVDYQHILHPFEVLNIEKAVDFCIQKNQKSVLVDIFERNEDGSIQLCEDKALLDNGKLKIHTIVLYIQESKGNCQLLVIDPSNSDFSKHLAHNGDIIFGYDRPVQILVREKQLKIYSHPAGVKTGSGSGEYRDCIDIAVKIAFGLNKLNVVERVINIEKIENLRLVQEITNQKDVNDMLFSGYKEIPARIRQASEDEVRDKAHKLLVSFHRQKQCADSYENEQVESEISDTTARLFKEECDSNQYLVHLDRMLEVHRNNAALIGQMMEDSIL